MFEKIAQLFTGTAIKEVGSVIDNLTTSNEEKNAAKAQLTGIVVEALNGLADAQAEVLKTEMKGNWLQRSWRPLVMLAFVVLLIIRWTGVSTHPIDISLELKLMDIIELGLGGYVVGRTMEKVATTVTQNVDMPFLKKKNR